METRNQILRQVKDHAIKVLTKELPDNMTYHSINHTLDVVNSVQEIADKLELNEGDTEILTIAAWFYDIGYTKGCENHE